MARGVCETCICVSPAIIRQHITATRDSYRPVNVYRIVQVYDHQIVDCALTSVVACRRGMPVQVWQCLLRGPELCAALVAHLLEGRRVLRIDQSYG